MEATAMGTMRHVHNGFDVGYDTVIAMVAVNKYENRLRIIRHILDELAKPHSVEANVIGKADLFQRIGRYVDIAVIDINDIHMEIEFASEKCELSCEAPVVAPNLDYAPALIAVVGDETQDVVLELTGGVGVPIHTVQRRPQFVQCS